VAAEVFATTADVYLLLGELAEDEENCNMADGRPATRPWAHARMARMLGGDNEIIGEQETSALARRAKDRQLAKLAEALAGVRRRMSQPTSTCVIAGSGEFLAREILAGEDARVVSLAEQLGQELSTAACAYAVALLAEQDATFRDNYVASRTCRD
jgi:uncharacterized hydantoinase/oxoprolinase family protein